MNRPAHIVYALLIVAAILALFLLWGCATSYEAREAAFMEAVEKARDRPCVPEYVLESHSELWEAVEGDSLENRAVAYADQELNHLEQTCGYLQK